MKEWSTLEYRKVVLAPPYRGRGHIVFVLLYSAQNHSDLQSSNVFRGFRYRFDEACCRRVDLVPSEPQSSESQIFVQQNLVIRIFSTWSSRSIVFRNFTTCPMRTLSSESSEFVKHIFVFKVFNTLFNKTLSSETLQNLNFRNDVFRIFKT